MTGKLIVFEGIDGCGKTTQLRRLQSWLAEVRPDIKTYATREPGGSSLGEKIRRLLQDHSRLNPLAELFLLLASRSDHAKTLISPMIDTGVWVLSDRYSESTIAYQGYGEELGLDPRFLKELDFLAKGLVVSDLTLWIDTEPGIAEKRIDSRPFYLQDSSDRRDREFYDRVRAGYQALANESDRIIRIDGNSTEEDVARLIRDAVAGWMAKL